MGLLSSWLGGNSGIELMITLDGEKDRQKHTPFRHTQQESSELSLRTFVTASTYPLFLDGEAVSGKAVIKAKEAIDHHGIKIELIGEVDFATDATVSGNARTDFRSLTCPLSSPGTITSGLETFAFEFKAVDAPCESYEGVYVRLRYFLRLTVVRSRLGSNPSIERILWFHPNEKIPTTRTLSDVPLKMDVGLEDSLQLEFEYSSSTYGLGDVVTGWISFGLVRVRVRTLELAVLKREFIGDVYIDGSQEEMGRWEMMEGDVHRGEVIPVRIFLEACPALGPTMDNVIKLFSVRYYLNLLLIDIEGRRYYKQQEITLVRTAVPMNPLKMHLASLLCVQ